MQHPTIILQDRIMTDESTQTKWVIGRTQMQCELLILRCLKSVMTANLLSLKLYNLTLLKNQILTATSPIKRYMPVLTDNPHKETTC